MRVTSVLSKHVPLIKFIGGPHVVPKNISHEIKAHPLAPNGLIPGGSSSPSASFSKSSIEPKEGEFFSRAELPDKYRYKPLKDLEIDSVISGGAEYVF